MTISPPTPRNISEIIAISLERPAEFTPFSRATPKKRNWKRSHLNDKGTIHFCWTAYFLAPVYANGKYTGTSSIPIVSRCKFLLPPPPGQAEITRRVAILVSTSLLVTRPCILANVRAFMCVCVATLCTGNRGSPFFFFFFFFKQSNRNIPTPGLAVEIS